MSKLGQVILIVGPAGSGKTTLAKSFAQETGWQYFEEDSYWVKNNLGHGLRTEEQEAYIQQQVFNDMLQVLERGDNVVLEFILYKQPPNPLTNYRSLLQKHSIDTTVVALKPSIEEIMNRITRRGRDEDLQNLPDRRKNAIHQLSCLEVEYIQDWVIDTTSLSITDEMQYIKNSLEIDK